MKILIIGSGGREHALACKIAQSENIRKIFVAPGNAGTAQTDKTANVDLVVDDINGLAEFAQINAIDLTIVGPEIPLVLGIVDVFTNLGLRCFGPSKLASQLEGSKSFAKDFFIRHKIPTADYQSFTDLNSAVEYLKSCSLPIVIKADGLAAGKGVIIAEDLTTAISTVQAMLSANKFGDAGKKIIIEQFLTGEEASFIVMSDGKNILPFATSQDHKALNNGDQGPNTGGMGAYSPAPIIDDALQQQIIQQIIQPIIQGMAQDGCEFVGFLYAGLMIDVDKSGNKTIKTLEINVRLGDPEAQVILLRLKADLVTLCNAALDKQLNQVTAKWDEKIALTVVMVADGYPGKYNIGEVITNISQASDDYQTLHSGTKQANGNVVTAGGRVLSVCALGNSVADAQIKAYKKVKQIKFNGAYYRDDIGFKAINI